MVRIALISIESDVLSMMEREANARGYEIVYKEHVRTDTLDRASADAFDAGAELVAACCHRPIQNVYMGVTVPVIYIKYKASELERNLVAACAENRCKPDETAFVTADLFLPGGLGQKCPRTLQRDLRERRLPAGQDHFGIQSCHGQCMPVQTSAGRL